MGSPSFHDLTRGLDSFTPVEPFYCISTHHRSPCKNVLPVEQVQEARSLLQEMRNSRGDTNNRNEIKRVRDLIYKVVCTRHRTSKKRGEVERLWRPEFPGLNFEIKTRVREPVRASSPASPGPPLLSNASPVEASTPGIEGLKEYAISSEPHLRAPRPTDGEDRRKSDSDLRQGRHPLQSSSPPIIEISENDDDPTCDSPLPLRYRDTASAGSSPDARLGGACHNRHIARPVSVGNGGESNEDKRAAFSVPTELNCDVDVASVETQQQSVFRPGVKAGWAPWRPRSNVLAKLFETLPVDHGTVYVIPVKDGKHVKIGSTHRNFEKFRLQEHKKDFDLLDEGGATQITDIPAHHLKRLEDLVHADLAYFQRDLYVTTEREQHHYREYFEVSVSAAARTVRMWRDILATLDLRPGGQVPEDRKRTLRQHKYFQPSSTHEQDEKQAWRAVNGEHKIRVLIWRDLFLGGRDETPA